jgi:hypothetical protein
MKILRNILKRVLKVIGVKARKRDFAEAVKTADALHKRTNQKCLVFYTGGEFRVVTKKQLRDGKKIGYFKGMEYSDIERRAMYVAGSAHVDHSKLRPNYLRTV